MGARGPAPTPRQVLADRGSWRAGKNPAEPRPPLGRPNCPSHLTAEQKQLWSRLCKLLNGMGVLSRIDGGQLERYAVYFVRWRECERFLATNGTTYAVKSDNPGQHVGKLPKANPKDPDAYVVGWKHYPQVAESHRLDRALKQIEANFGLTPSARTRIAAAEQADDEAIPTAPCIFEEEDESA